MIGRHPLLEALRAGRRLHQIMVAEGDRVSIPPEILRLAAERNVTVRMVPRERLDVLADHHQGVVAEADPYTYSDFDAILSTLRQVRPEEPPLVLVLDALQDPQNFGSLLRTALATGADGVVLPERRSVGITAAAGRASAGAIEYLSVARVVNLPRALRELKQAGLWVVGLDAEARTDYHQVDLAVPLALVVGAEGRGLSRLVAETCDVLVRLPMAGPLDSLNAAVAGSVVLYETLRQRRVARG